MLPHLLFFYILISHTPCCRAYQEADLTSQLDVSDNLNNFADPQIEVRQLLRFLPQSLVKLS